ncbi:hypothetical protein GS429_16750 [Natronorubrum sp. JWXQ-INN-674]|uniref:Uncharacterized protein n=1 Tax=Natronorubrum halalkaliphilum TaxID=2691917 RepID=A0A6B0VQA2_9EURY|nr:hypothetical protein [Natronorubrum halalkaliphilum]MXV63678.1 hypothetical protein [Natronorubrum halalkaliphilum]
MAGTHTNALAATTAELHWDVTDIARGEPKEEWTVRLGSGEAIGEIASGEPLTIHWAPDSGYWRGEWGEEATYGRHREGGRYDLERITRGRWLRQLVLAGAWGPPQVEENGRFTIEAETADETGALADAIDAESIESYEATGSIDEDGIIREFDAEYQYTTDHTDRLHIHQVRLRVDNVGDVSVSPPDWIDTARDRAPEVTMDFVQDRQFIELTMHDGNPMVPPTYLTVHSEHQGSLPIAGNLGPLSEPVSAGDTLYLYLEDGVVHASRDELPDNVSPEPFEDEIAIWAQRGREYFFITSR